MTRKQLIELYMKLDMIWFSNIKLSANVDEYIVDEVKDQRESIESVMDMLRGEIEKKFKIHNGDIDYNDLFCGKYDIDKIVGILNSMGSRKNSSMRLIR